MSGAISVSPLFEVLDDSDKDTVNHFIEFTYHQHNIPNELTQQVIKDAEEGKNIIGTFSSVKELMDELNA